MEKNPVLDWLGIDLPYVHWPSVVAVVVIVLVGLICIPPDEEDLRGFVVVVPIILTSVLIWIFGSDFGIALVLTLWLTILIGYILTQVIARKRFERGTVLGIAVLLAAGVWFGWSRPPSLLWGGAVLLAIFAIGVVVSIPRGFVAKEEHQKALKHREMEVRELEAERVRLAEAESKANEEQLLRRRAEVKRMADRHAKVVAANQEEDKAKSLAEEERRRSVRERFARNKQLEVDLKSALATAEALDKGVPTEDILLRETATLETLYRAKIAPQQGLSVSELASSAGLQPEIALKTVNALSGLVIIEGGQGYYPLDSLSKPWHERQVSLTEKGVKQVRGRHDRATKIGVQVNHNEQKIGNVSGNVGGPGGDMTVTGGSYYAGGQTYGTELADFVQAVRTLQADLTEDQAGAFEDELTELSGAPTEAGPTVRRIVSMARLAGKIGVPVIEAGRKLYDAIGPS